MSNCHQLKFEAPDGKSYLSDAADVVKNWMRSKNTIEFLGFWERTNNANFKLVEFDQFWEQAGENAFVLSPKINL